MDKLHSREFEIKDSWYADLDAKLDNYNSEVRLRKAYLAWLLSIVGSIVLIFCIWYGTSLLKNNDDTSGSKTDQSSLSTIDNSDAENHESLSTTSREDAKTSQTNERVESTSSSTQQENHASATDSEDDLVLDGDGNATDSEVNNTLNRSEKGTLAEMSDSRTSGNKGALKEYSSSRSADNHEHNDRINASPKTHQDSKRKIGSYLAKQEDINETDQSTDALDKLNPSLNVENGSSQSTEQIASGDFKRSEDQVTNGQLDELVKALKSPEIDLKVVQSTDVDDGINAMDLRPAMLKAYSLSRDLSSQPLITSSEVQFTYFGRQWEVALLAGPSVISKTLKTSSQNLTSLIEKRSTDEEDIVTLGFDLTFGRHITKNLSIHTGCSFSTYGENVDHASNSLVEVIVDSTSTFVNPFGLDMCFNRYDYLEVPLHLSYMFPIKNGGFVIQPGITTGLLINEFGEYYNSEFVEKARNKSVILNAQLGLGYELYISDALDFRVLTSYKAALSNFEITDEITRKYRSFNLRFGLGYKF